jgi:hypothetical protein
LLWFTPSVLASLAATTSVMLPAMRLAPDATSAMLRDISAVVAVCSSTALAMVA